MSSDFSFPPWIWRDGELIAWDDAQIHVMTHAVHYGSSIFEGIRCYSTPDGPAVFRLQDHLHRFLNSARVYRMELGWTHDQLAKASVELIAANDLDACYLRPLSLRGVGSVGLNPAASPMHTYLICWPWGAYLGKEALEEGVDVCVSSWSRPAPNTFPTQAKAGGHYMNAQLMKMEAVANGYAEAIALTPSGLVSEGSGQNIFLVRDGALITPRMDGSLLSGITRDSIIQLANREGIPVRYETVPREALYTADELFFTGTAAEVTPVRSVDRIQVGPGEPGPVTRRLQAAFLRIVQGEEEDQFGWLTPVAPLRTEEASSSPVQSASSAGGGN
jgi:branched-chain amino acid aminotransferase